MGVGAISIYWKNSNPFALFHYKIKLNYTGVDIKRVFFPRYKIFTNKTLKCFLESSYGTSQTSKLEIFTKKVNGS